MLYKLVLGPTPILRTNVHENPLTTFGISRYFNCLINLNEERLIGS